MLSSISFPRLYRARRLRAEPRVADCVQPGEEREHEVFEANQPVNGSLAEHRQRPVQPGSMPEGHGIRSFVERDLARPLWAGMASKQLTPSERRAIISQ